MTAARLTQAGSETLSQDVPVARLTQAGGEVLNTRANVVRATGTWVEVLNNRTNVERVTGAWIEVLSSTAVASSTARFVVTGSGQVTISGTAIVKRRFKIAGSGRVRLSGTATVAPHRRMVVTGSGLVTLSGSATVKRRFKIAGSGQLTLSGTGSPRARAHLTVTGSGALHIVGTARFKRHQTGAGHIAISGSAGIKVKRVQPGSGPITLSGTAAIHAVGHTGTRVTQVGSEVGFDLDPAAVVTAVGGELAYDLPNTALVTAVGSEVTYDLPNLARATAAGTECLRTLAVRYTLNGSGVITITGDRPDPQVRLRVSNTVFECLRSVAVLEMKMPVDWVFPGTIALGASGGPNFSTGVVLAASGREVRNRAWSLPVRQWSIALTGLTPDQITLVKDFFLCCAGRYATFLFLDPTDHGVKGEPIGVGDGVRTQWQLYRSYAIGALVYHRPITRPKPGTAVIYANGPIGGPVAHPFGGGVDIEDASPVNPEAWHTVSGGYAIDPETGVLTFSAPPDAGTRIAGDFEFYTLARFGMDALDVRAATSAFWDSATITIVEVREKAPVRATSNPNADVRFPDHIPYGSVSTPAYSTTVLSNSAGWEQRSKEWALPRRRWQIGSGVRRAKAIEPLMALFLASSGRFRTFRLKDFADFQGARQYLGMGNDADRMFPLRKRYASGSFWVYRPITRPVPGTVVLHASGERDGMAFDLVVPTTGAPAIGVSAWSVNTLTGLVTFTAAVPNGVSLHADFEFDCVARFDTDSMAMAAPGPVTLSWSGIPMVEVLS